MERYLFDPVTKSYRDAPDGRCGCAGLAGLAGGRRDDRRRAHPRHRHRRRLRGDPRLRRALDAARRLRLPLGHRSRRLLRRQRVDRAGSPRLERRASERRRRQGRLRDLHRGRARVGRRRVDAVRRRRLLDGRCGRARPEHRVDRERRRRRTAPVRDHEATGVPLLVAANARLDERVHARARRPLLGSRDGGRRRRPARMELQPGKPDRRVPSPVRDDGRRDGACARRAPRRRHAACVLRALAVGAAGVRRHLLPPSARPRSGRREARLRRRSGGIRRGRVERAARSTDGPLRVRGHDDAPRTGRVRPALRASRGHG